MNGLRLFRWSVVVLLVGMHGAWGVDVPGLVERMPEVGKDGKYTGPTPAEAAAVYGELLAGGEEAVVGVVRLLAEPGEKEDYKARYLLHGLVIHVTRPGLEKQRETVTRGLVSGMGIDAGANVKTFLIGELQVLRAKLALAPLAACLKDEALSDPAARALVAIGEDAIAPLRKALPGTKGTGRLSVIQALGDIGASEAVPDLLPLLKDQPDVLRVAVGKALAPTGDPRATEPMLAALSELDGAPRNALCDACFDLAGLLAKTGSRADAFRIYRHVWRVFGAEAQPHIRYAVIEGLAIGYHAEPTPGVVALLKNDDPATRAAALHVLGQRADPATLDAIGPVLSDPDAGVRMAAIRVLPQVGGARAVPLLVKALPGTDEPTARALENVLVDLEAEAADGALGEALGSTRAAPARLALLSILAQRKARPAAEAVFALTTDGDPGVRVAALEALVALADGSYAPRLLTRLQATTDGKERKALAEAILETCRRDRGADDQVRLLTDAMDGADEATQCALVRMVGKLDSPQAVTALVGALEQPNAKVRDEAMRGLSQFPNDRPAAALLEIAATSEDEKHQVLALRGYLRMAEGQQKEEDRLAMLDKAMVAARRADEKRLVVATLGKVPSPAALQQAVQYLSDPEISNEAALAAIGMAGKLKKKHPDAVRRAMEQVAASAPNEEARKQAQRQVKNLEKKAGGK